MNINSLIINNLFQIHLIFHFSKTIHEIKKIDDENLNIINENFCYKAYSNIATSLI